MPEIFSSPNTNVKIDHVHMLFDETDDVVAWSKILRENCSPLGGRNFSTNTLSAGGQKCETISSYSESAFQFGCYLQCRKSSSDDDDNDSEDEEETLLINLKQDIEEGEVAFNGRTYEIIFNLIENTCWHLRFFDTLAPKEKKRITAARLFCRALMLSEKRVPEILTKYVQRFINFLLQTLVSCANDECAEAVALWFYLMDRLYPPARKQSVDGVLCALAEVSAGERDDKGLEFLLLLLPDLIDQCNEYGTVWFYSRIMDRLLIPLYRQKYFYMSPRPKRTMFELRSPQERRSILLRDRMQRIFASIISKFPEIADMLVERLCTFWGRHRHLRVIPLVEEIRLISCELTETSIALFGQSDKVIEADSRLKCAVERCARREVMKSHKEKKLFDKWKAFLRQRVNE